MSRDDRREENLYLLLDSWSRLLAKGRLEGPVHAEKLQVQVLEGRIEEVLSHEVIQLIGMTDDRALMCRLLQSRNDRIVLEKLDEINAAVRHNLRIPVRFETLIYPVDGKWNGRRRIESIDLSCGGIAFYSDCGLEEGETLEVVIPITEEPLIVRCKILRMKPLQNGRTFYAAKFIETCHDEEKMIRRAVFNVQIRNDQRKA